MCAIVGSFNKSMLTDLFKLNAYRGELSYSLCSFDDSNIQVLMQDKGKMPGGFVNAFPPSTYYIGHTQAPTGENSSIHPASKGGALLWHNGIVKAKEIPSGMWDTEWMLEGILRYGFSFLSKVDGTFACVLYKNNVLYVFRNEISPLFVDGDLNISSTKFAGSVSLTPNTVFVIDIQNKMLQPVGKFETKENPYYFS